MAAPVVMRCTDGWYFDVFPHLVQGDCTNETVLYGAGEQVGAGLLYQHADDVAPRALIRRSTSPCSVHVYRVERAVCAVVVQVISVL